MLRRRAAVTLAVSLLALAALAVPGVSAGSGSTRVVDDDGRATPSNCDANASTSSAIQPAINASGPGDTVLVCPGTYTGQLRVGGAKDGLRLIAKRSFAAKIRAPLPLDGDKPPYLLTLRGDDVAVVGFTFVARAPGLKDAGDAGCTLEAMVWVEAEDAVIRGNRFRPLGDGTLDCGYRVGVQLPGAVPFSAGGTGPLSAHVAFNAFDDFQEAAIDASGTETELVAERNTIRFLHESYPHFADSDCPREPSPSGGPCPCPVSADPSGGCPCPEADPSGCPCPAGSDPSGCPPAAEPQGGSWISDQNAGISLSFGATGVVRANGIASGHDARSASVRSRAAAGNDTDHATPMLDVGVRIHDSSFDASGFSPSDVRIDDNDILRAEAGILVRGATDIQVRGNLVTFGFFGIALDDAFANRIVSNLAASNFFGIAADFGSAENRIRDNEARGNLVYDCYDESGEFDASGGTGTHGTNNFWIENRGNWNQPQEICEPEFD